MGSRMVSLRWQKAATPDVSNLPLFFAQTARDVPGRFASHAEFTIAPGVPPRFSSRRGQHQPVSPTLV